MQPMEAWPSFTGKWKHWVGNNRLAAPVAWRGALATCVGVLITHYFGFSHFSVETIFDHPTDCKRPLGGLHHFDFVWRVF